MGSERRSGPLTRERSREIRIPTVRVEIESTVVGVLRRTIHQGWGTGVEIFTRVMLRQEVNRIVPSGRQRTVSGLP